MTDGAIHQMSEALGGLRADVNNMRDTVANLTNLWMQREEEATSGRRIIHKKIDDMSDKVIRLSAEVENVSSDLTEIKPAIDEFKQQRQRQIGAKIWGGRLWAAMLAAAGGVGWAIHEFFTLPKPH